MHAPPQTDVILDRTAGYGMFSFMDGYSGYNQSQIAPEEPIHTTFITPLGLSCFNVMPFGLKNAGATYISGAHPPCSSYHGPKL